MAVPERTAAGELYLKAMAVSGAAKQAVAKPVVALQGEQPDNSAASESAATEFRCEKSR